jgi:hypothetical protein
MAYADDANLLEDNRDTIKMNTEYLIDAIKEEIATTVQNFRLLVQKCKNYNMQEKKFLVVLYGCKTVPQGQDRKFQIATVQQEVISGRKSYKGARHQDILTD